MSHPFIQLHDEIGSYMQIHKTRIYYSIDSILYNISRKSLLNFPNKYLHFSTSLRELIKLMMKKLTIPMISDTIIY